jgi:hypothetical protein
VTVNSTDPIFFYCSQASHCSQGMVGAVNPTSAQTVAAFQNAAKGATSESPASVFGGVVGPASASTSSAAPSKTASSGGSGSGGYGGGPVPGAAGVTKASVAGALGAVGLAVLLM